MEAYGITEDRVIYTNSTKNFYGESPEVYETFLGSFKGPRAIPREALILHDGGRAFKRQKESILESAGFNNHVEYPTDVHQYLSPNDNRLHGCKAAWYEEYHKLEGSVAPTLRLMQLIDLETTSRSKIYFQNNLLRVKKSDLKRVIGT